MRCRSPVAAAALASALVKRHSPLQMAAGSPVSACAAMQDPGTAHGRMEYGWHCAREALENLPLQREVCYSFLSVLLPHHLPHVHHHPYPGTLPPQLAARLLEYLWETLCGPRRHWQEALDHHRRVQQHPIQMYAGTYVGSVMDFHPCW